MEKPNGPRTLDFEIFQRCEVVPLNILSFQPFQEPTPSISKSYVDQLK